MLAFLTWQPKVVGGSRQKTARSVMGKKVVGKRDVQMSWAGRCAHSGQTSGKRARR